MQSYQLTVDVADAHLVIVDKVDSAYSRARQGLRGIAAHASYSEHRYTRVFQFFQALGAYQKLQPRKFIYHTFSLSLFTLYS